ncbi:hypothetical protein JCM16138_20490 [Thermococcus atlanticus]
MVYFEHTPDYGAYLLMLFLYYVGAIALILYGAYINRKFLMKKRFVWVDMKPGVVPFLKKFLPWLLIGLMIWSFATFKLTDYYLSSYSFTFSGTHLTGGGVVDDFAGNTKYTFDIDGLKRFGVPKFGLLKGYKLEASEREGLLIKNVDQTVVIQGYPFLPVVKLYIYDMKGNRVVGVHTAYMYFPRSPSDRLRQIFDFPFALFYWSEGGGPGA